jgi:phospholipid/cholesterol/gamma-HCH transport system ATP-binding protein
VTATVASQTAVSSDCVLRVTDVVTRFDDAVIHDGLSLDVMRGEILGIVGGSGAGKTVLLQEMMLLQEPNEGHIEILGQDAGSLDSQSLRRIRRRMGVLFQHGALFTGLTVRENVILVLKEHARLRRDVREDLAGVKIALAGLPASAADKYPEELSGGMIKRAALARALALDPELLFLDEPTSGLDPLSTSAFDALIVELRNLLGLTVVMVTHDPESLRRTTNRVAFLANGRVWAQGPINELIVSPDPLTREYFHGSSDDAD